MRTFAALSLLFTSFSLVSSTASFARSSGLLGVSGRGTLFGVPRGGGLFGGKDEAKTYVLVASAVNFRSRL